jgi:hypothetical protein
MSPRDTQSSVTLNGSNSSQFDNSRQYTNTSSNRKSDINAQERKHANNPGEDSTNSNRRSFNKVFLFEKQFIWSLLTLALSRNQFVTIGGGNALHLSQ